MQTMQLQSLSDVLLDNTLRAAYAASDLETLRVARAEFRRRNPHRFCVSKTELAKLEDWQLIRGVRALWNAAQDRAKLDLFREECHSRGLKWMVKACELTVSETYLCS